MPRLRPDAGFTLLELLVAIAILALVAVGAYQLLFGTIATRDHAMLRQKALGDLQRAQMLLQRDLLQAVRRPVRDEFGDVQAAFVLPRENSMEFTRLGWRNPLQQARSDLVRVRWQVLNGRLLREHWPMLDRARSSAPLQTVLLEEVSDFRVLVYAKGSWTSSWPPLGSNPRASRDAPLPEAVEIRFRLDPWGDIRRVIVLPAAAVDAPATPDAEES